jgi:uncharacterized protein involved in response to NO
MKALSTPLLSCGFRPFFLLAALYAVLVMVFWAPFWSGLRFLPETLGGPIAWHVHELIFGFVMAALAGFISTATPEFTGSKEVDGGQLLALVLLWLAARICFWASGLWGIWPALLTGLALPVYLLLLLTPPIWNAPGRKHASFVYILALLTVIEAGFFASALRSGATLPWLYAAIGTVMALIIVAMSRISMRIINGAEEGIQILDEEVSYLARPPRRNMAIFAIGLFTATEFVIPGNPITGWFALAAAAAMLNLLNDWHIGRALFNRWIFALYAVYWLMALGYLLIGLSLLAHWPLISGGRHLLTIGAIGLAVLLIMTVAGQVHTGRMLRYPRWLGFAVAALVLATLIRALLLLPMLSGQFSQLILISACGWITAFGLYGLFYWKMLTSPAADGRRGCL